MGLNLLEMPRFINFPGGLNSWIGFAPRWGGYRAVLAPVIENAIRIVIPGTVVARAYEGYQIGQRYSDDESE